jgi:hypothetical protein
MFAAVGIALVLLLLIGAGGFYLFTDWLAMSDPFSTGLGLKGAALVALGVSFVAILVMTVASGGDAIFGELPFTILGFLIFFVIFWLLTAWIF